VRRAQVRSFETGLRFADCTREPQSVADRETLVQTTTSTVRSSSAKITRPRYRACVRCCEAKDRSARSARLNPYDRSEGNSSTRRPYRAHPCPPGTDKERCEFRILSCRTVDFVPKSKGGSAGCGRTRTLCCGTAGAKLCAGPGIPAADRYDAGTGLAESEL
jgi:hypothetical protein